jgi:hypothetical protein
MGVSTLAGLPSDPMVIGVLRNPVSTCPGHPRAIQSGPWPPGALVPVTPSLDPQA